MSKVLIVGAGGVGGVVAHKCAMNPEVFTDILLASRTVARCEKIQAEIKELHGRDIRVAALDAMDVPATVALLKAEKPEIGRAHV